MSNAAQEPRRIQAYNCWLDKRTEWVEASAYDALLAERDALKERVRVDDWNATHAVRAELAAIKEKAEMLHTDFRNATIMNLDAGQECEKCEKWWKYDSPIVERHAPDCPARPDFLTTSATESRGAKGGNDERNAE